MKHKCLLWKRALRAALFILLLSIVGMTKMYASYDFSAVCETGQTLYYNITDEESHYVELTYPGTDQYNGWWGYTKPAGDMVLPENVQYDGLIYSVTSIGDNAFRYCSGLTTIEIPNSVISIGSSVFSSCSGLTSIEIPNSVTSIGNDAFNRCSGLVSIEIPNSVTSIGNYAFFLCSSLTSIEIPSSLTSINNSVFQDCSGLTSIEIPNSVTSIGGGAFSGCSHLTEVHYLGDMAEWCSIQFDSSSSNPLYYAHNLFINNELVTDLVIPETITEIKPYTFYRATCLTSLTISNSVTSIGSYTFYGCIGLTTIDIPNSVTSIGDYAFSSCIGLTTIDIPNSVTSIDDHAFSYCSGLTSIEIPNSVTFIGNYAFYLCRSLTSIEIPNSVTSIGSYAFSYCSGLTSIEIPNSVTSIGSYAFSYCSGLTSIEIPNSVTFIGNYAFYLCRSLTSIEIPNSITSISRFAFSSCSGLTSIEIPNSVTSIGSYAFSYCSGLTSIEIPNSITSIDSSAFNDCSGLTEVHYLGDMVEWCSIQFGNSSSNPLNNAHNLFINNALVTDLVIPETVTEIKPYAFYRATCLASLTISNSVTLIGNHAFSICSGLSSLTIPDSVTSIGEYAFSGCGGLTSLTLGNSVTSIGRYAFASCPNILCITSFAETPPSLDNTSSFSTFYDVFKAIPFCVPCGSEDEYASLSWGGFNNFYGMCGGTVTVTANPEEGMVTGDGTFEAGQTCTITATAMEGYTFAKWTLNGVMISNHSEFTFYVSGDMALMAHFVPDGNIVFADSIVKSICVSNWDINGDDELSYSEAASVLSLKHRFTSNLEITSFDELQYFIGLISIDDFNGCTGLTSIVLPNSITSIGGFAFQNCSGLTGNLTIPNSVISIGYKAFYGCSGLTGNLIIGNSVTSIGDYAFEACGFKGNLTIGSSVTSIGHEAFYRCSGFTSMTVLADNPPTLGYEVFYNVNQRIPVYVPCGSVEAYRMPRWGGFYNISGLCGGTVTVAANPEEGGMVTGGGIVGVNESCTVTANANEGYTFAIWTWNGIKVSADAEYTFYVPSDMDLVAHFVPDANITFADVNVKAICVAQWDSNGDGELSYAEAAVVTSLENVFSYNVFSYNTSILTFDEFQYFIGLTSIDGEGFCGCNGLTSIEIPNSVTSIGHSAFDGCSSLTSIEIPNSVISLGSEAFFNCTSLASMTVLADNPPTLSSYTFYNVNKGIPVYVLCGSVEAYTATHWGGFNNFIGFCGGTVTMTANPEEGGMVSGGGIVGADETCTVTATANEGYAFAIWTRDGIMVSDDAEYTFYVREDMCLVAQFVPNANITFADANVKSICINHWDTNGDGELSYAEAATVTNLGEAFRSDTLISSFNELQYFIGLTSINNSAFSNCNGLTSIEIPNSVTSIGVYAFSGCNGLEHIIVDSGNTVYDSRENCNAIINTSTNELMIGCKNTVIPNSVTSIGSYAFSGCNGLASIEIPNSVISIGSYAFRDCSSLTSIGIPNSVTLIGSYAFYGCSGMTFIEIPNSVASINSYTFSYCTGLTSIEIPNTVTSIGNYAFSYCTGLTSIEIPNSVTSMSFSVFQYCIGLEQITVDSGNTVYDSRENCNAIIETSTNRLMMGCKNTVIPNSVTSIGSSAFRNCSGLTYIEIPNSVTLIESAAFYSCSGLTSIEIPNSVTSIGSSAFYGCSSLTTIAIPNSVTSIGDYAFQSCSGLTTIEIPNSVTSIGSSTFSNCSGLISIVIPSSVNRIYTYAFTGCTNLESITVLAETPPTLYYQSFYNCPTSIPVYVPCGSVEAYQSAAYWNQFTNIQENCTQTQTITLSEGWNWCSFNVEVTLDDLKAALVSSENASIIIKSKTQNIFYQNGSWRGNLSFDLAMMYKIYVGSACEITLEGMPINPSEHPITIHNGPNWIGYPLSESMSLSDAFAGFAVNGDIIKHKGGSANYLNGQWRGSFNLEPGQGYIYNSNAEGDRTLTFPASAK